MKGQFYILAAFIVGMYVFFLLRIFTSTRTAFEVPDIPQVNYIHDAVQAALNQEGSIDIIKETINYIPEPIGIRCTSLSTGQGSCDLYRDDWVCGVNVTVVYRGKIDLESTKSLYIENFAFLTQRTPIYIFSNESANLVKVLVDVGISEGSLLDSYGNTIKGSWSGTTVKFRTNLVKNRPKTIQVYHFSAGDFNLLEDVAVLNDVGYSAAILYNQIKGKRDVENVTFGDFAQMRDGAGPRMLFIPGAYPDSYASNLMDYVDGGGVLVAPYGLCKTTGSCLVGNIETISSGGLDAIGDFSALSPVDSGSLYFTNSDESWVVYDNGETNSSRAAIGATAYGEGYVVFVGNESMLTQWSQLDDFLNELFTWGVKPVNTVTQICPMQTP
ncbi:MAG: hypothetical protein GOU98_03490 [Candidatus Altiarchaeota archaeon]|nr:hypothetical protein [Candidatus Altiarchaeota archaeon]